jgi:two-component system, chemotaxis family, protein-glutamate methylesterase/glutaminase
MAAASKIRTLLIEDSAFMRKLISDILRSDSSVELVGVAKDGQEGSEMALALKPDVLVTDMIMPEYDGLYVVDSVMRKNPIPIILLSSLDRTDYRIFDALRKGAFDFIDKPSGVDQDGMKSFRLLDLIKEASLTDITLLKEKEIRGRNSNTHTFGPSLQYDIIVIGASTGGPGAVEGILCNLPRNLRIPVVVVQHMPHRFLETFAERLNDIVPMNVQIPRKGETLKSGIIYVAPGIGNLRVEKSIATGQPMFTITDKLFPEYNHPSIDCLFESVAGVYGSRSIGVILTGMGKDGTRGLGKIKEQGGFTIAQDEYSSVVYGMPKAAKESGAVKQVVPLREIPGFLISCL